MACIVLSAGAGEFTCPTELSANVLALISKTAAFDTLRFEVEAIIRRRLGGLPNARYVNPKDLLRPREFKVFEIHHLHRHAFPVAAVKLDQQPERHAAGVLG